MGNTAESLIKDHTSIICLYRNSATGRPPLETNFLLTPNDFTLKLQNSYGPKAIETCNKKGDVFKRLSDAIGKLSQTAGNLKEGMAVWESSDPKTESEYEVSVRKNKEEELTPKLKKAGLLENTSDATIRAQSNYNVPDKDSGISGFLNDTGLRMAQ